jgi:benzoate 4-monooxygenase
MHHNLELFETQWSKLSETANGGYARLDALNWFNYLAFDIIGDLAFGAPFDMLKKAKDEAEMRTAPNAPPTLVPAIEVLNRRGEVSG